VAELEHLSPTRMQTWERCRRQWGFKYLDRLPDPGAPSAAVGTFAHETLERFYALDADARTHAALRRCAGEVWDDWAGDGAHAAAGWPDLGTPEDAAARRKAWKAVESIFAVEDPARQQITHREHEINAELAGVPFKGVIDRADARGRIVDYKTGKPLLEPHRDQVALYWLAWWKESEDKWPPPPPMVMYLGEKPFTTVDLGVVRHAEKVLERWKEAADGIRGVDAASGAELEASPGYWCRWCPGVGSCPEGSRYTSPPPQRG